ncbi:MAG: two-component system chemotaxis sensor kinase CheA [Sulfurimonas sp.]|jgi:two-component system chemotaxis sensor kinase CheA|uniref:chemotaxis protein CheA n=1 Tax=Sulfurimonas sp. TaxID=2022749 RepID=UPI0039E6FD9E
MDPLLEQFLQEARENLAFIDQNIEEIGGDDPELLNSVFRAAHTLKGGSGIVGFESVKVITHHAEDLLDMLRGGKLDFKPTMTEALYDAFDEVMNLIEAAEESEDIVDADENIVNNIVTTLSAQMGKELVGELQWELPFTLTEDPSSVINPPLKTLNGVSSVKVNFTNAAINEDFCANKNFYAIIFDVDESCMVYGNDPVYTLSLLGEKVLGVFSCMSDINAKSVLSGTEDEDGLLLKSSLIAYIYASYEDIEDALFNFIDELQLLPLDIQTLLSINVGDAGLAIDSLKELADIAEDLDLAAIAVEVNRSMKLVGSESLQYAQLQRFLDIVGLIKESDTPKLADFFKNLHKGKVLEPSNDLVVENIAVDEAPIELELIAVKEEIVEEVKEETKAVSSDEVADEATKVILNGMMLQQLKAIDFIESDDDLARIESIMESMRKYFPQMPKVFVDKQEIKHFLELELDIVSSSPKTAAPIAEKVLESEKISEPVEVSVVSEKVSQPKVADEAPIVKQKVAKKSEKLETQKAVVGKTVKIDQESIDSLMNVAGELLVAKNSLPYLADGVVTMTHDVIKREIMEKYIFINRLTEQLQDLIMGMRMLPISYVFDRYPKLVRDIAKKLGKKVKLEMVGGETKLDKNMIEMLADPMIHIMRNSLDHGIEMPETRVQKGKESSGSITLRAYAESDRIVIEIIDDGAGINTERVAHKVIEKGLMSIEEIDALSEDERAELVLLPGLSTAEEITEFSGRGVGMDVVKKSIEGFGGTIRIKTKANQGTVITLAIPVSLAVTSLLHIQMNNIHYGIPMDAVSETVKIEKSEIEYLHNEPFIYLRGSVIPLLFIKSMLDDSNIDTKPLSIVVLNIKNNLLAVVVNDFLGQLDVVQKPLVGMMAGHPLFSGTALLGNGQIIMAMDPLGLLGISQKLKDDIQVA